MQIGIDIAQKTQIKLESQVHTVAYDLPDQFPDPIGQALAPCHSRQVVVRSQGLSLAHSS